MDLEVTFKGSVESISAILRNLPPTIAATSTAVKLNPPKPAATLRRKRRTKAELEALKTK